jgi:multimeric flavodoxin WrbA
MIILGINGSPRENGNTYEFLDIALTHAALLGAQTQKAWLGDKNIRGCRACYGCVEAKRCVVEDDFQPVFAQMLEADAIVLGSPVYHASMTAEMKALLDRAGFSGRWAANPMKATGEDYQWSGTAFSGKVIAPVTVARRTGQTMAFAELLLWAACNDCITVGNTYWNMGMAGKGGAVNAQEDAEGIGIMRGLAERIVYTVGKLRYQENSNPSLLQAKESCYYGGTP